MWEEIVNLAIQNGLFAVLFLGLFIFTLRDSAKREKKYQQTIENLNKNLDSALDIEEELKQTQEDIKEIKNIVSKTRSRKVKTTEN